MKFGVVLASIVLASSISHGTETAPAPTAATLPAGAKVSEMVIGLPGLSNVGRVAPGIYRGAQPKPEGYPTLKQIGIKTVINLRNHHSEKEAVEKAGMISIEVPINIWKNPDPEKIGKVVALLADPANHPVFLHCAHGEDRTGAVVAVYRMQVDGWGLAEAEAEMQAFGFTDVWMGLKKFVRTTPNRLAGEGAKSITWAEPLIE